MKSMIVFILGLFGALMMGCSNGGNLTLEGPSGGGGFSLSKAQGAEFVSSSDQFDLSSPSGYKVQESVGDFIPNIVQTSSPGNYKLYSSVQGAMISDETN